MAILKDGSKIEDVDIKGGKAVQAEIAPASIVDPSEGEAKVVRFYKFSINPAVKHTPSRQELFNSHIRQIEEMLWRDGLKPHLDIPPKVMVSKKGYTIALVAEPKLVGGSKLIINEKPRGLQEILSNQ